MHLPGHTDGIWWFWFHIWNLLKIWTQKTYRPTYVVSLWVNLIQGLEYWNIHNKGDKPDMKIPSSDPPSAHQIGPDDVLMTSVRGYYTMSFPIALINLIVAEAIGQLWRFCVQILNLRKKNESRHRLNHSIQRRSPTATITDLAILGVTVRILRFFVQIWILLKKPVQTQFKPFHLEEITQPPFQPPSLI